MMIAPPLPLLLLSSWHAVLPSSCHHPVPCLPSSRISGPLCHPRSALPPHQLPSVQVSGEWWEVLRQRDAARDAQIAQDAAMEAYDRVHQRPAINPLALLRALQQHLPPNTILVGDGGDFVAACSYVVRPRAPLSWLDPGVFGTLGVGAGFALAAATVCPDRQVWAVWVIGVEAASRPRRTRVCCNRCTIFFFAVTCSWKKRGTPCTFFFCILL